MASSPETTIPEDSIENNKLTKDSYDEDLGLTVWPEVPKFPFQPDENEKNGDKTTDDDAQAKFSDNLSKHMPSSSSRLRRPNFGHYGGRACGKFWKRGSSPPPGVTDAPPLTPSSSLTMRWTGSPAC